MVRMTFLTRDVALPGPRTGPPQLSLQLRVGITKIQVIGHAIDLDTDVALLLRPSLGGATRVVQVILGVSQYGVHPKGIMI